MTVTHINTCTWSDEPQHVLTDACWCEPTVSVFTDRSRGSEPATIVDHHGDRSPAVALGLEREAGFDLMPHQPVRARRGTRNEN